MTTELFALAALCIVAIILPPVYLYNYTRQVGIKPMMGNRDGLPERTGIAARGTRAHANLIENLVPFAGIVLTAQVLGISNTVTQVAAIVFLLGRLVHLVSYLAGVTIFRTIGHYAGVAATFVIASQLFI